MKKSWKKSRVDSQDFIQTFHKFTLTSLVRKWTVSKRQVVSGEPKRSVSSNSLYNFFSFNLKKRETKSWWNPVMELLWTWTTTRYLKHHRGVWGWISILQRNCKQSSLIQKSYFSFYCSSFIVAWNFLHDLVYVGIRLNYFSFFQPSLGEFMHRRYATDEPGVWRGLSW